MKKLVFLLLLTMTSLSSYAVDNAYFMDKFNKGSVFGFQEKLYVQTDRDSYTAGETIWFRVHRVDATYHNPRLYSGLVYVDIYDYDDKLMRRMMITPRDSVFHGSYKIPSSMTHGSCYMVAYTNWLQNFSDDLYYRRKIFINNPQNNKVSVTHKFSEESRGRLRADFEIVTIKEHAWLDEGYLLDVHLVSNDPKKSKIVTRQITADGKSNVAFSVADSIQYLIVSFNEDDPEVFSQRFVVPFVEDRIDLQFMPEGGALIAGMNQRVAFKAVSIDGLGAQISGTIFKSDGSMAAFFGAAHLGMGDFMLNVEAGQSYYAEFAMPDGTMKRVDLPEVQPEGVMVACTSAADVIKVMALATPNVPWEGKHLLIQCRGKMLQALPLSRNSSFNLPTKSLPNGVVHCSIIDSVGTMYSQRLVFINHDNEPQVVVDNIKSVYPKRNMVDLDLSFIDANGSPVAGSYTASVIDEQRAVADSTIADMRSYLLLSSDLSGNVENPNYYFDERVPQSRRSRSADLLMLTQGWTRFDLTDLMLETPRDYPYSLQMGQAISGRIKNLWKDEGRAGTLAIISSAARIMRWTSTDSTGYFELTNISFPDGTKFVLQGMGDNKNENKSKSTKSVEVVVDDEGFKSISNPAAEPRYLLRVDAVITQSTNKFDEFYRDLRLDFYYENGVKIYIMDEISVVAEEDVSTTVDNLYRDMMEKSITSEDLTAGAYNTVWDWLSELPGITVDETEYTITVRGGTDVSLLVNDVSYELSELSTIMLDDIEEIGFTTDMAALTMLDGGADGALVIQLKSGASMSKAKETASFFTITPMGYHKSDTFYVARYDTPERLNNTDFDGRVTVHWEPVIAVDGSGKGKLQFYTADFPTDYLIRIEGVTVTGNPVSFFTRIRND